MKGYQRLKVCRKKAIMYWWWRFIIDCFPLLFRLSMRLCSYVSIVGSCQNRVPTFRRCLFPLQIVLESDHIIYRSYAIIILHVYNFLTQNNFTYIYIYMYIHMYIYIYIYICIYTVYTVYWCMCERWCHLCNAYSEFHPPPTREVYTQLFGFLQVSLTWYHSDSWKSKFFTPILYSFGDHSNRLSSTILQITFGVLLTSDQDLH